MHSTGTPSSVPSPAIRQPIGRVIAVGGSSATVELNNGGMSALAAMRPTVGKFLGIMSGETIIVGMVTEISEQQGARGICVAHLDMFGEVKGARTGASFSRGVTEYPAIGEPAILMTSTELRLAYTSTNSNGVVGTLHQDSSIEARVNIEELLNKHFAILGTTGVGKSTGISVLLQQILAARANLRIFLVDPHNEYGRCFGDQALVLNPRNLRLPFWLFNFEETVDVFFGGRPGVEEEVEILSEVIPIAKGTYLQYRNATDRTVMKRRDPRNSGFSADTPAPYRLEDLITLIDERMGKLENRSSRMHHYKLLQRIQTIRNHPRYGFMFENANVGGDTMADVISSLFRLPANGKPLTVMQLAGFPAEVIDAVVSVLCRMAFDFGLWSDGAAPLLFVCEEAHRYAAANAKIGFGPTRRALSRIAKEGRKYGVYLGLVTQRPAEIDPNIISQCNTLFVMRLSNERDQALIRSAVSDAASSLLTFVPSLGTGEVFVFGAGVALPMRMRFNELPAHLRPTSDVAREARGEIGESADLITSAIERWRNSTMSQKSYDDDSYDSGYSPYAVREEAPPMQPAAAPPAQHFAPTPPAAPAQPTSGFDPQRSRILKQPLDRVLGAAPAAAPNPYAPPPPSSDPYKTWR